MAVHVDDMSLIGPPGTKVAADAMSDELTLWLLRAGFSVKSSKGRPVATTQLISGFVWDSVTLTRTLDATKLSSYLHQLLQFAESRAVSLRDDSQKFSARIKRAVMTLPQGAGCLLANLFAFMRALSLPYYIRRTSSALRRDLATVADLLQRNMGRGLTSAQIRSSTFESLAFERACKTHLRADSANSADSAASHALADCRSHAHASLRSHGAWHWGSSLRVVDL
eukprot:50634-Pleurochrysis_carterae.AAC.1